MESTLQQRQIKIEWEPEELAVLQIKENLTISQWTERYRVLSDQSEEKGPVRLRRVPYSVPIMDAALDPNVEEIVWMKSAQIAGTETMISIAGYYTHQEPCPIMFCMADSDTAEYMSRERIQKMYRQSPSLSNLVADGIFTRGEMSLANGAYLCMAWSRSIEKLASRPMRILVLDEVDKPGYYVASKEADPISLAKERTISFWNRKIFILSTPTIETGHITKELESCDVIFDWHVPCPFCGQFQPLRWSLEYNYGFDEGMYRDINGEFKKLGQVVWKGGRAATKKQVEAGGYQCGSCEEIFSSFQKNNAVEKGIMVARTEIDFKPKKIGFHINRIYSLLGKSGYIPNMIEDFIKCLGNPKKLQGFVNSSLAEPWKMLITRSTETEILKSRCDLDPQIVPAAAVALTAFVDPQKDGFWFCVRAWARDYTSWLIHYGFLGTWDEVQNLLFETHYPIQGKTNASTRVWRAAIDTGGGKFSDDPSMTEQAYWFVKKYGIGRGAMVWGTKGATGSLNQKVRIGKILEKTPSGKAIIGGLQLIHLDTSLLKDMYHHRLQQAIEGGEQAAYLHKDTDERYARQIMAEEKQINEKGLQEWVQIKPDNHFLDCETGCMALADIEWPGGGVHLLPGLIQIDTRMKRTVVKPEARSGGVRFSRPDWLDR